MFLASQPGLGSTVAMNHGVGPNELESCPILAVSPRALASNRGLIQHFFSRVSESVSYSNQLLLALQP
jgi:hypothetical protein